MIVCIGEVLVDIIQGVSFPGGSVFNTALAARRLGAPVVFLDNISEDIYGKQIMAALANDGIIVPDSFCRDSRPTMYSKVTFDAKGQASYEFKTEGTATINLNHKQISYELNKIDNISIIQIGSVGITLEPSASAILNAINDYCEKNPDVILFVDPNFRPTLIEDKKSYCEALKKILIKADIVKLSDEDLKYLMFTESFDEAVKEFASLRKSDFIVTLGANGAQWYRKDNVISVSGSKIVVCDTIGAGDTFNGALLYFIEHKAKSPVAFTDEECQEALLFASHAAEINCTRQGCNPPRLEEL